METNRRLLEANLDACNRMIRVVVDAVKERRQANVLYDADGAPALLLPAGGAGMALTLDRDI